MKEVRHTVDEDHTGPAPVKRLIKGVLVDGKPESVTVLFHTHLFQVPSQPLGIAILAAGAYFRTPCCRIPARVSPFD